MSSLDSTFNELRAQLKKPDALNPAKSDPLFYFVHAPEEALEVKKKLPLWTAMLREDGREVQVVFPVRPVLAAHRRLWPLGRLAGNRAGLRTRRNQRVGP